MKRDIVYILKNDISSEELKYSLRSVCENFPYRKIIFIGGCPSDLVPDVYIPHLQTGSSKWEKVRSSMIKVLKDERITDEFFLFNDDFFVLSKQKQDFVNFANGTLEKRITDLQKNVGFSSSYGRQLTTIKTFLMRQGKDTVNFALHLPFLVDKKKALELMKKYPKIEMFRSFYANMLEVPYVSHKDVKIYDLESLPLFSDYLSTTDKSFSDGAVGAWIRKRFSKPCKYEVQIEEEDS